MLQNFNGYQSCYGQVQGPVRFALEQVCFLGLSMGRLGNYGVLGVFNLTHRKNRRVDFVRF